MFHVADGLFFERLPDGSVRVVKTNDGRAPATANVVLDQTVAAPGWASVISNVSADGETSEKYAAAVNFHGEG